MKRRRTLLFFVSLFFAAFCVFFSWPPGANSAQEGIRLFELIGTEQVADTQGPRLTASIAGVREQEISINFGAFNFEAAQGLSIPLLDGRTYEAVRNESEGFERFADDEFTWRGKIQQEGWSGDVILSVKGQAMSGLVYSPEGVYEIVPQENFRHLLVQIDQSRFPACAGTVPAKAEPEGVDKAEPVGVDVNTPPAADAPVASDDGSQIDVLVVYTGLVRSALGGTTQTQAFIQQAIASTNTAYQNSGISPRLRLVNTMEVGYNEAAGTLDAALNWIDADATVAAARNTAKADMVAFIVENASDGCGLAHVMRSVGSGFSGSAYSATARSCAVGNLSFAHELGHNQGCEHNPENGAPSSSASYPYAFGHYVNGSFRTVMSYSDPCTLGCTRVPYFSNPSVTYNASPTGIANQRDNHRVINNTALTISLFRDSGGGGGGGTVNLTPYQPTGWSDKVVVSKTTGTSTDSNPLNPTDTLYVDWAVLNNGSGATATRFYSRVLVDGVERGSWYTDPPLSTNTYVYVQDFYIGSLSTGTHTVTLQTDYSGAISESNEADNNYTKTISVIGGGLQFYPLPSPVRLLDTRAGLTACDAPGTPLAAGVARAEAARTTCTGIPSTAQAIVGNAAVVNSLTPSSPGFVTLYPGSAARPNASSVNYEAGGPVVVNNAFTVGLSTSGAFNIYANTGVHMVVDVTGYYAPPGTGGLYYHPLPAPVRLLDTRPGQLACDAPGAALGGGGTRTQVAALTCTGIPTSARALVGNAAVVNSLTPSSSGFITLYPTGATRPNAASVNYEGRGPVVVSNSFTVGLNTSGAFNIYAQTGVHFVVDVTGYYNDQPSDANGGGLTYYGLTAPVRLLDTRPGQLACYAPGTALAGGVPRTDLASNVCTGVSASARAVVGNAVVVNSLTPSSPGFITLYPSGASRPNAANVNYEARGPVVVGNFFNVGLSTGGSFNTYSLTSTHMVVDLSGYYAP